MVNKSPAHLDPLLEAFATGRVSEGTLVLLASLFDKLDRDVDVRLYSAIKDGTVTSEKYAAAWHEKFAIHKLRSVLEQKARIGTSAGAKLAEAQAI